MLSETLIVSRYLSSGTVDRGGVDSATVINNGRRIISLVSCVVLRSSAEYEMKLAHAPTCGGHLSPHRQASVREGVTHTGPVGFSKPDKANQPVQVPYSLEARNREI